MRRRVTLYFVQDDRLLLMGRYRDGRSFHVVPGGGVEPGETLEMAACREALEETSLSITLGPLLWQRVADEINEEYAFLVAAFHGTLRLGGPEAARQSPTNRYYFEWVPLADVPAMLVWPGPVDVLRVQTAVARLHG